MNETGNFKLSELITNHEQLMQVVLDKGLGLGITLFQAMFTLIVGWFIAAWVYRLVRNGLSRIRHVDPILKPLIAKTVRYVILAFVFIAVLAEFGVQTASIIAALGAIGLAIGLALQGTLSNIAAGIMLLFLRPFRSEDYIDAEGIAGTVKEMGLFTTELETFDGIYRSVPNSQIWNRAITNYSRNPKRRLDVVVGISYGDDLEAAIECLEKLVDSEDRILADPARQVLVKTLNSSSVDLNMRCWCRADDYWDLLFLLNRRAKLELEANGFTIPFPQRDLHLIGMENLPKAENREAKPEPAAS